MRRASLRTTLVAVLMLLGVSIAPNAAYAEIPTPRPEGGVAYLWEGIPTWSGGHGPMRSVAKMRAGASDDSIHYESRRYGINLGYTEWRNSALFVAGEGLSLNDPITPTTNVALYFTKGGYLKYQSRENGVPLVWSETPVYEWRIEPAGSSGSVMLRNISSRVNPFQGGYLAYVPVGPTVALGFGHGPVTLPS